MDIGQLDVAVIDRIMAVNVRRLILLTQAALPHMIKGGGGSIINTSSLASLAVEHRLNAYSMSKAAVNMLNAALGAIVLLKQQ